MSEEKLDRFARGELSAAESRELAQRALDAPELFEELTYTSIARGTLSNRRRRRNRWVPLACFAAAAAIVIAVVPLGIFHAPRSRSGAVPISANLPSSPNSGPPIFLAYSGAANPVFRSDEPPSRSPRAAGSVTSMEGGTITVDLGSLDGLVKGGEIDVFRDGNKAGTLQLTTVFRERARGKAKPGLNVHLNDEIRVPAAMHMRAILDQIEALSARGDSDGALRMAGQAVAGGEVDMAATAYEDLNNLGAIAELNGDRMKAVALYEKALRADPPQSARQTIETNLTRVRSRK